MLSIPPTVPIFLYTPPADLRKGFDGLSGLVRREFAADPLDGSLFLFINRRRDRLKILHWDGTGYWLYYRLLEAGTFETIASNGPCAQLDSTQLAMLLGGVLWCAFRWYRTRGHAPLLVASVLMGLGMSNHHTIALAGPALVLWILMLAPRLLMQWRLALKCVACFLIGLLPYLYLPIRASADPPVNWGDPCTLKAAWEHVSRHQYGALGPMKAAAPRSLPRFAGQMRYLASSVADDLTPWLAAAGLVGLLFLLRRKHLLLFSVLWLLATGVLFALLANYGFDRTSRFALRVFLIPVSLGLVIPLAVLMDLVGQRMIRLIRPVHAGLALAGLLCMLPLGLQVAAHLRECNYRHYWYAYDHARNLLDCMLPNAVLFPSGDHNTFPLVYLVMVEGRRPDVLIADIYGYMNPALHTDRPANSPESPEAWFIRRARRPVYYTTKTSPPVEGAQFVPAGLLYHLLPEGKSFEPPDPRTTCSYRNLAQPAVRDLGADHILSDYHFFCGLAAFGQGRHEQGLEHFRAAAAHSAGIKEGFNNLGSASAEHGEMEWAIEYFTQAAELDPHYLLPRWNLFHIHKDRGRSEEAEHILRQILLDAPDDRRAKDELAALQRASSQESRLDHETGTPGDDLQEAAGVVPHEPMMRQPPHPAGPRPAPPPRLQPSFPGLPGASPSGGQRGRDR